MTNPSRGRFGRARLRRELLVAQRREGLRIRLRVAVMSDPQIRRLNRTYRGKDRSTDVLAFPGETARGRVLDGDVAVSIDTARREARRRGHLLQAELTLYAVHGLLHLAGERDHRPRPARRMAARQERIVREIGHILQ